MLQESKIYPYAKRRFCVNKVGDGKIAATTGNCAEMFAIIEKTEKCPVQNMCIDSIMV